MNNRRGAVAVLFAAAAPVLILLVGLAIDFGFWNQAQTYLKIAADTAAMSAVRVATNSYISGSNTWQADGETTGSQWWSAQASNVKVANATQAIVSVSLSNGTMTATVSYTTKMQTFFGQLANVNFFPLTGNATAVQVVNPFVNIALMLDNSSSMLIGATANDINVMQAYTPCSLESANAGQNLSAWTGQVPTCAPPPGQTVQAPCGFACHSQPNTGGNYAANYDYYYLARNPSARPPGTPRTPVTLRFDVVQAASANVIAQMQQQETIPNQFGLTVYTFNQSLTQQYPTNGVEYSNDLAAGEQAVTNIGTPQVNNAGDTDFPDSMAEAASLLTQSGDGSSSASPKKYLFLVTDGIQDYSFRVPGSSMGPISTSVAIDACNAVKAKGITVYVLYTDYTPLPYNPFYVNNIEQFVPDKVIAALQTCASSASDFYEAANSADINTQLQKMLRSTGRGVARITN